MGRVDRVVAPGYPHHVTQRGNRRRQTFFGEEGYRAYLEAAILGGGAPGRSRRRADGGQGDAGIGEGICARLADISGPRDASRDHPSPSSPRANRQASGGTTIRRPIRATARPTVASTKARSKTNTEGKRQLSMVSPELAAPIWSAWTCATTIRPRSGSTSVPVSLRTTFTMN